MRLYVGSDHAGFALKEQVREHLEQEGHEVVDVGTHSEDSVDYPDFARQVGEAVAAGDAEYGILVCGSGLGMAIAANKVDGVRAVQVMDTEMAKMSRMHNDANVVTLAGRYTEPATADAIVDTFLATAFEGGRHQNRVDKITAIEHEG
ncbi:MAG: ribose 5-phosphate isomerase B [Actinobacteria bacterium HGW-Actinobacteria-1]|jgi:ribose 5-phosphate isomerase B|nr:MAG: ribose 5-phosphate isomerase B [Actinobacteria bacterium HGW-Actinobacteria-1]